MPALTYPDQITYYGFCKTDDPFARKAFPHNPVDPEEVLREGKEIHAWVTKPEADILYEEFNARAKRFEASLAQQAVATGAVVLSACGSDCLGNLRPYDVEDIVEPFYQGLNLHFSEMPLFMCVLNQQECLDTWRAVLELSRHPWFKDESERFDDILHVFRALKTLAKEEDWIVIGLMRSYYLHNG
jgi:hypothetical protein